jgi:chemotaxis protein histidine kinase CheA
MLRNWWHGIEMPEERRTCGKPEGAPSMSACVEGAENGHHPAG